jgi:hypothetical protein
MSMSEEESTTTLTGSGSDSPPSESFDWKSAVSEEVRSDPSLSTIKDIDGLAKSYVHSQKMIGADKVMAPREDWGDSEWSDFFEKTGRPSTAADYSQPEVELPDGYSVPDETIKELKDKFHEAGLSDKQAKILTSHYMESGAKAYSDNNSNHESQQNEAIEALRSDYGRDYDLNVELARSALNKFGSQELTEYLDSSGFGNNPHLIRAFVNIGKSVLEDDARGGSSTMALGGPIAAQAEITTIRGDEAFMSRLTNRDAVGHKEALAQWEQLHRQGYSA